MKIQTISIQVPSTINCLKKTCFGTEEQGGAAQSVNFVKENAHDTSLPQANAALERKIKRNCMLCILQIRSTYDYDKVLNVLQNLNVCITGFIFVFILNVWYLLL